ncbi:hypothetical protein BC829DRAFT_422047 [Chytridium lagenaria]|nr:hypothetical protein BC829DRAFT_422047 [Chytridium lagenaria]
MPPNVPKTTVLTKRTTEKENPTTIQEDRMQEEPPPPQQETRDRMEEEEKDEHPLTVKKRPRPEDNPDHPDDVGIIAERGIRFPKINMADVEIVDGLMKDPTIKPEDITVPILNAFLKTFQPLLQCPACEGIGNSHQWKPFGQQGQAPLPNIALFTPPMLDTTPKKPPAMLECKKDITNLFTAYATDDNTNIPPVIKKMMQKMQQYVTLSENHIETMHKLYAKIAQDNLVLKQRDYMGGNRPGFTNNYADAVSKTRGRRISPTTQAMNAIARLPPAIQREHLDKLADTQRNPVTNAPLRQREPAIKRTPMHLQSEESITNPILRDKVREMKWTTVENLPGENRTVIRQYLRAQGMPASSIVNVRMMGNRTEIAHYGSDGNDALKAMIDRIPRLKRVDTEGISVFEDPNKEETAERYLNSLARDMVQAHDMAFIIASYLHRIPSNRHAALIEKTSNLTGIKNNGVTAPKPRDGTPTKRKRNPIPHSSGFPEYLINKFKLHFIGLQETFLAPETRIFGYEDFVPFDIRQPYDANTGLARRGISIMRNPTLTTARDFELIEKDPDGDYIWFRYKGVVRIGVFYIPPNLKRTRHYRKKLSSIRRMHQMFPAEPTIIMGDFNTRLGQPHNGDLRGSPEWQKAAFIDCLGEGNMEIVHNPPTLVPPWTFQRSGLGSGNSIIDYIAVSTGLRASTNSLSTERRTPVDTDHKLIWTDIVIPDRQVPLHHRTQPLSHGRLNDPRILTRYKERCEEIKDSTLTGIREALDENNDAVISDRTALEMVDRALAALTTPLAKVLEDVIGRRNPHKPPKQDSYWDEEMKGLARERQEALQKRNDTYLWSPLYEQAVEDLAKARRKLQRTLKKKKDAGYRKWTEKLHTANPTETEEE